MKFGRVFVLLPSLLLALFIIPQETNAERLSVKVGAYANAPKIFQDEQGVAAGFWPELIAYIAKQENWQVEYVWGTWSQGLNRLKAGEIDLLPDVAVTESRKNLYDFSQEPVLLSWSRLYIKDRTPAYNSIFDLNGKKIAVLKNSVNYEGPEGIKRIISSFAVNCSFAEYESYNEVFAAVSSGSAYGGVANRNYGDKHRRQYDLKETSLVFQPIYVNFAFFKESTLSHFLQPKIDGYLKLLKKDPESFYFRLLEKYFETEIAEKNILLFRFG